MVKPNDVVLCNFPYQQNPNQPAKQRPGLVKQVLQKNNETFVVVAYGTSNPSYVQINKLSRKRAKCVLPVGGHANAQAIGLHKPTYFDLSRISPPLPYNEEWFGLLKTSHTAVVGSFEDVPALMKALEQRKGC